MGSLLSMVGHPTKLDPRFYMKINRRDQDRLGHQSRHLEGFLLNYAQIFCFGRATSHKQGPTHESGGSEEFRRSFAQSRNPTLMGIPHYVHASSGFV